MQNNQEHKLISKNYANVKQFSSSQNMLCDIWCNKLSKLKTYDPCVLDLNTSNSWCEENIRRDKTSKVFMFRIHSNLVFKNITLRNYTRIK